MTAPDQTISWNGAMIGKNTNETQGTSIPSSSTSPHVSIQGNLSTTSPTVKEERGNLAGPLDYDPDQPIPTTEHDDATTVWEDPTTSSNMTPRTRHSSDREPTPTSDPPRRWTRDQESSYDLMPRRYTRDCEISPYPPPNPSPTNSPYDRKPLPLPSPSLPAGSSKH